MKRKILSVVLAAFAVISCMPNSFAASRFADVPEDANYKEAVEIIASLGVVGGDDKGNFNPDRNVTRAEFSKMAVSLMGYKMVGYAENVKNVQMFEDVPTTHWANGFIVAAQERGIINGVGNGLFAPSDNVTYFQAVKMLACMVRDCTYAEWPLGYKSKAHSAGIIYGMEGDDGNGFITRATAAKLMANTVFACLEEKAGNPYEQREIYDGNGKSGKYKTLLTEGFNAYYVTGTVTEDGIMVASGEWFWDEKLEKPMEVDVKIDLPVGTVVKSILKVDNSDETWEALYVKEVE